MKAQKILKALLNGETLASMGVAKRFNTTKLVARVSDIEKRFNIYLNRKEVRTHDTKGKLRSWHYEYSMKKSDIKKINK